MLQTQYYAYSMVLDKNKISIKIYGIIRCLASMKLKRILQMKILIDYRILEREETIWEEVQGYPSDDVHWKFLNIKFSVCNIPLVSFLFVIAFMCLL